MKKILLLAVAIAALTSTNSFAQRYQGEVNVAFSAGVGNWALDRFNVETVHGVRFTHLFAGAGVGFDLYTPDVDFIIPVFANAKYYILDRKITPYVGFDIGYGIGTGDWSGNGGLYLSPAAGIEVKLAGKKAVNFGLAYQSQQMEHFTMNAIALKGAFNF